MLLPPYNVLFCVCLGSLLFSSYVTAFTLHNRPVAALRTYDVTNFRVGSKSSDRNLLNTSLNRGMRLSAKSEVIPGIGDEGCALPSPSGVNTLPLTTQMAVVFGCLLGLYGGTVALVSGNYLL